MPELSEKVGNQLIFSPHSGQWRVWQSEARYILMLAGTQSGKTSLGPHWLYREIQRKGPGDYLIVTPTFQLLEKRVLPEFKKLFEENLQLGWYSSQPSRKFTFSRDGLRRTFPTGRGTTEVDSSQERRGARPLSVGGREFDSKIPQTVVWFGYAEDPQGLESMTCKAAWCDEAGQDSFKLTSWEAILRRLSVARGRVLITTTPYSVGWLKQKVYDPWKNGNPDYDVIQFESTVNPVFPREEYEAARGRLPTWKFNLFYRGMFTRPAGLIYDSFIDEYDPEGHKIARFPIPRHWNRYMGMDFGGVNTAATKFAEEEGPDGVPTGRLILYETYHEGGRTAEEHVEAILRGEPTIPFCVGGNKSEGQWRTEFRAGGLSIRAPLIKDVEVGIDRVYGAHRAGEILVFDDLDEYLSEKTTYTRKVDENGNVLKDIKDKEHFHLLDSERYIIGWLKGGNVVNEVHRSSAEPTIPGRQSRRNLYGYA